MFDKIKTFLYTVTHASGRLLRLKADLGPFCLSLWAGREDPDAVRFAVDIELMYGSLGPPTLDAAVDVGVIHVELSLTRSSSE